MADEADVLQQAAARGRRFLLAAGAIALGLAVILLALSRRA